MPSENSVQTNSAGATRGRDLAASVRTVPGRLLGVFLRAMGNPPIRAVLWDGEVIQVCAGEPEVTLTLRDLRTLLRLVYHPELEFGEAYSEGRIEVEGDLVRLMELLYCAPIHPLAARFLQRGARVRSHTLANSRHNIHQHYDLGNEFYRLWLDREMVYTCAYFPTPEASLEEAQIAKMEHVCRKVALRAGDRVVEAGCGWGSLALYMARKHGAKVRAFNISKEQIAFARERARQEGLGSLVEFVEDDYRNVAGEYDVFMSVGMLEHVGPAHYQDLGRLIDRCLPADGRGLIHTIGRTRPQALNAWIEKRIFPGAYPPSLGEMMEIFAPVDLNVLDVENLRMHYARTAEHWLERYLAHIDEVRRMFDDSFARAWKLYLSGTVAAFTCATLELFQVTFARARHNTMPWTRAHLYEGVGSA